MTKDKQYRHKRAIKEKRLKYFCPILKDGIKGKSVWWKDSAFGKELDWRYNAWVKGTEKGFTQAEVDAAIELQRAKRGGSN